MHIKQYRNDVAIIFWKWKLKTAKQFNDLGFLTKNKNNKQKCSCDYFPNIETRTAKQFNDLVFVMREQSQQTKM